MSWHHVIGAFPRSAPQWKSESPLPWKHHGHEATPSPLSQLLHCSHQSHLFLPQLASCLFLPPPPFILTIRNGLASFQPPQRLSQIRPLKRFHNTRERKDKTLCSPLLYFYLVFIFYLCTPLTHTFINQQDFFCAITAAFLRTPLLKFPNHKGIFFPLGSLLEYLLMQSPYGGLNQESTLTSFRLR